MSGAEWADGAVEQDLRAQVLVAERRRKEVERENKALLKRLADMQDHMRQALALRDYGAPKAIKPPARHKFRGVAVALLSDWHVEEHVRPETVNGLNEYTPAIAERRARRCFQGIAWAINHHTTGDQPYAVDELVLWLGGDFFSGYIHDELEETNFMSPVKAVQFAARLITGGIDYLLANTSVRLTVPCSFGNHGRTTQRKRISSAADNSFEWLMYGIIASRYEDNDRVRFEIADGAHLYLTIADHVVRFDHGDDVRYAGGVGGITIPMRKAVAQWNRARHADLSCFGHYHQIFDGGDTLHNGSLIGWGPFASYVKAGYEDPAQLFFMLDPDRGKRFVTPIMVEDRRRLAA